MANISDRLHASRERRQRRATARRAERSSYQTRRLALATATPYLSLVHAPATLSVPGPTGRSILVASYNVHRWTGQSGRGSANPRRAAEVIAELDADVIALQEVLRPFDGEHPLAALADALQLHAAFATTRVHRRGEVGNAILARWPISSVEALDLSFSRIERRAAIAARFAGAAGSIGVMATHLALMDRTRARQVQALLNHSHFRSAPVLLLGDLNAWRRDPATRALDRELRAHHNLEWPASFPSARPVLALDRIYARGAEVVELFSHRSEAARRASDHLPVVARIELPERA